MNVKKFREALNKQGVTNTYVAKITGMNESTLYRKLSAGGDGFTVGEVKKIVKKVPISIDDAIAIFFN